MTETRFWQIIEEAEGEAAEVTSALTELSAGEIAAWARTYWDHHSKLHRWDVWGAAYVINGGCGDDSFHYFKAWLIGKGRTAYETALKSPDDLGPFVSQADIDDGCDNESLNYAAEEAYEDVAGKELPTDAYAQESSDPAGEPWDEEEVDKLFPKLAQQFGSR